jgi:hypothetical protein
VEELCVEELCVEELSMEELCVEELWHSQLNSEKTAINSKFFKFGAQKTGNFLLNFTVFIISEIIYLNQ